MSTPSFRVIGAGRAGGSLQRALTKAGWNPFEPLGRGDDLHAAAVGVDVLIIATPDAAIAEVAAAVAPVDGCAVVHLSGSLGLDVLAPHARRATLHPLLAMADADTGARHLFDHAWFAVTEGADPIAQRMVEDLDGRSITIADDADARALHHAACCVAANYVTTVLGQVERLASAADVPVDAYLALAHGAIDNVAELGAAAALTGPVSRGDHATVDRHRAVIDKFSPRDRTAYDALATATADLAGER